MNSDISVAIVGGGPCGLLTALLLARTGVRCTVFEKRSGISTHPKAMGLSRRTCEIFRQLGLLEEITSGSMPDDYRFLSIWAKSLVGEELGRVPFVEVSNEFSPCSRLHCPQTWTEKVLLDAVSQEPLAEIRFNCEVVNVEPEPSQVRLCVSGNESLTFGWLVAADGAGSAVRHQLHVETAGPGDMGHFLNVMFRANYGPHLRDRRAILYPALSSEYFEHFVAVNGADLWLMHHFLQPGERVQDYTFERMQPIVAKASGLPDEPVEVLSIMPWVMSPKVAALFRIGRVLLVGDAAARLSPAGGLGLNTGLQAAHNLAWKLAFVVLGHAADSLLDTYQEEAVVRHSGPCKILIAILTRFSPSSQVLAKMIGIRLGPSLPIAGAPEPDLGKIWVSLIRLGRLCPMIRTCPLSRIRSTTTDPLPGPDRAPPIFGLSNQG
jgi:2-polyprenyl-6-methoxyphenol hydroxylase-like FAD-dependent oxidoreductase